MKKRKVKVITELEYNLEKEINDFLEAEISIKLLKMDYVHVIHSDSKESYITCIILYEYYE